MKSIQTNINQDSAQNVIDDNQTTGWTTGRSQLKGDYLELFLNQSVNLYGITIFWEGHGGEYPHHLAVESSNNGGRTWQSAEMTWSARTDFVFKPVKANTEGDDHPWYVNHLLLYTK